MPASIRATLMCDDIRVENNGKLILIGVYTPSPLVPQIPFVFPSLSFFQIWEADAAGEFQFRARLRHTETGATVADITGLMKIPQPGVGIGLVKIANLRIDKLGAYDFSVNVAGEPDPIGVHSFSILLQSAQPQPGGQVVP